MGDVAWILALSFVDWDTKRVCKITGGSRESIRESLARQGRVEG